jgi:iron(III) transport system permease protein
VAISTTGHSLRPAGASSGLGGGIVAQAAWWLAVAVLALLIAWPIGWVVLMSFDDGQGGYTFDNYIRAVSAKRYWDAAVNSLILSTSVGFLSVIIATPLAWAIARTNMPGRRFVQVMALASLITPGFLTAVAWILLAGPNAGLLNQFYRSITGFEGPLFNVLTMKGMIFVTLLECFPFAFIIISSALQNISAELEDAANISGAGTLRTMWLVTLPLVMPAIMAGFILAFLEALVLFSSPAIIGVPARTYVLTTQIWALFQYPPQIGIASALSLPLLLITMVLLFIQRRLLGRRGYVTVTGKAAAARVIDLGWARWPMFLFCFLVVMASAGLTYIVLYSYAASKVWGALPFGDNFTFENFRMVLFDLDSAQKGLKNSLVLAFGAASVAVVLGGVLAYVSERELLPGAWAVGFVAMAPMVIPGIVFAVGLFSAYTRPPLILYGTLWILFIAYLTKFLPLAYMNSATAIKSVSPDLEEAARISGAGGLRTFRRITVPLVRQGLLSGWFLVFIYSLRELSSSILLFTNNTVVASVAVYDLYETGAWPQLSALGFILLLINTGVIAIGYSLVGKSFVGERT